MAIEAFAPAKINLTLHVTGRRTDGYHLLDSLVCFASAGDRLTLQQARVPRLVLSGPHAARLAAETEGTGSEDNLAMRAARMAAPGQAFSIRLEKNLPVAAGIGGGSSDAAAVLRAVPALLGQEMAPARLHRMAISLGADVPVCLQGRPARLGGIGERISPLAALPAAFPECAAVLVNPGVPVATPQVFGALSAPDNPPMPETIPPFPTPADLAGFLREQRNDLEAPAIEIAPVIGQVLPALRAQPGCLLARMSGSGATCFALFRDQPASEAAARAIAAAMPAWWVVPVRFLRDETALRPVPDESLTGAI